MISALLAVIGYAEHAVRQPQEWVPELWHPFGWLRLHRPFTDRVDTHRSRRAPNRPSPWFGWTVLIVTGLTVIVLVFVSAFPPLLFYMIMWFLGIVLIGVKATDRGAGIADPAGAAGSP